MKQKATIALFEVTIIWGWTFVWLKQALDTAEIYSSGDQTNIVATLFVALRFGFAIGLFFIFVPSIREEIKGYQVCSKCLKNKVGSRQAWFQDFTGQKRICNACIDKMRKAKN